MFLLLLVGFLSILGQVVLLREMAVAFYGVELVYLLALGAWLACGAVGAVVGRRRPVTGWRVSGSLALLFAACGLVFFVEILFVRGSRVLFGGVPGSYLAFGRQMTVLALGVGPASALLGLLFQRAARAAVATGGTLAMAYAVESAGGLAGGVVSAAGLAWGASNLVLGVTCVAAALAGASVALPRARRRSARLAAPAAVTLTAVVLLAAAPWIDLRTARWNHPGLVVSRDSPYGRITITRAGTQFSIFENDSLSFETEGVEAERLVHFAALAHPMPRRVLLLGGTAQGVAPAILEHHPERVDLVEPNRVLLTSIVPELPLAARSALGSDRVHVVLDDPRRFVRVSAASYDLVLVSMPEPASGEANRFYTREFFVEAASRLSPGGILAFRLQAAENYWTPVILRRTRSIHLGLASAFSDVVVLPGASLTVLASTRPLERDPGVLAGRLRARGIRPRLVSPAYISYSYSNDRFAETASRLASARAPVNSDNRPICYELSSLMWLSTFFPALAALDPGADQRLRPGVSAAAIGVLFLILLAIRRWRRPRQVALVFVAGAVGMTFETALLLHYQLKNGVIYQDLGLLLTAFMAGLAAGAWGIDRWTRPGRTGRMPRMPRGLGLALALATAGLGFAAGVSISRTAGASLAATCGLLAMAGLLVSAVFAFVSLQDGGDQDRVVAPLYSADLLGGAAGSILSSLALIPLAGLSETAALAAAVALGMVLLV